MTVSISEHLKKVEWPTPRAWKVAFHSIDGALSARLLTRPVPAATRRPRLLNLGCGPVRYPGWVNADFFTFGWIILGSFQPPEWVMDATKPWKCPPDYWDGIFTEHVLEHLSYKDAIFAIGECYRTLRPGAWLRISVPDIDKFISSESLKSRYYRRPVAVSFATSFATQHFEHRSVWDASLMMEVAAECGFTNVRETEFGCGSDERLIKDQEARRDESFYVEAQKPNKAD
ncbi:MAG TPA: hypothetical protein VLZ74_07470 [Methylocella sp.]|nr:hypothetical protein [Methylocella sp.]